MSTKILIVEDEAAAAMSLEGKIQELGYESAGIAFTAEEAIEMARTENPDLILMDIQLREQPDGIEAAKRIHEEFNLPVIFVTAFSDDKTLARAKEGSPYGYIMKPYRDDAIKSTIEIALNSYRLEKEIIQRLQERVQSLADSNERLEHFTALASHDLRAPARSTSLFADLLAREYASLLDEKGKESLNFVVSESRRMHAIVNDLLEYSKVSHSDALMSDVSLVKVMRDVLAILSPDIMEKRADVKYELLPTIFGSETQLRRLFLNVIGNALKYSKKKPKIEISATESEEGYTIIFKDNGIGVAEGEKEKIFEIFRRGYTQGRFPGTGIGLASCKKVMENHHGKIWVESVLGEGSSFYLFFPKREPIKATNILKEKTAHHPLQ